jgi:hypothetical protein
MKIEEEKNMKTKIIATIMALGMVMTAFAMLSTPVAATVPTFNTINLLMEPVVTDRQSSSFQVVGACNVAVDATLEVSSTTIDFVKGTGTTFTSVTDNNAQGTFRIAATVLLGATTYYWRLTLTNGVDTIDFPSTLTTRTTATTIIGVAPANGNSVGRVYGTANTTGMGINFLAFMQVETAGVQSIPMSVMSAATSNAVFIGNNLRRADTTDYMQVAIGSIVRYGAYGNLWGTTWYNHTIAGGEPTSTVFPIGTGQCQLLVGTLPGTYDIHVLPKIVVGATYPPEATALTAWNPPGLAGVITSEWVRLNATITDTEAPSDVITAAEYRVDGGAWTPMTAVDGSFNSASEAVTAVFNFPNGPFAIGAHTFDVRGTDNADGLNATFASSTFTITDTTAPVITTNSVPGATIYANQPAVFQIGYGDFTQKNNLVANSYFRYRVGAAPWTTVPWVNGTFAFGSYTWTLGYTIPALTFAAGNVVTYEGRVTDTAAAPNIGAWAGGSFTVLAAAAGVQDPYPITGRVYLYAGTFAGGYTPLLSSTATPVVTATWIHSISGATLTRTGPVNALGQFSIDLLNYTNGARVMLTVPAFDAPYNNAGSNWTTIDIVGFPGGREQNVICGVPYSFTITAPAALSTVTAGVPFPTTYIIRDRAGLTAQGYYTFNDGNARWTSGDLAFVPPATTQFNGLGGGAGVGNNALTLFTMGNQWINISETVCDWYPTPWNNFQVMTGFAGGVPVNVPGWLDDFDQITVIVTGGGFDWRVVNGWNIVSVPQNVTNKGGNGIFDAFDALNYCRWQLPGVTVLSLADRVPGNPSTYNMFDYGQAEGAAFPMDGTHGYWVYSNVAGFCHFNSTNYTMIGANVVNAAAGWNLLGFTHNFVTWTTTPTAAMFTTGAITPGLNVPALTKIVATQWLFAAAPQWYNSYVVTTTFPGMGAPYNWAWDFGYSQQPGNGYFLWLSAPVVITFNVNY